MEKCPKCGSELIEGKCPTCARQSETDQTIRKIKVGIQYRNFTVDRAAIDEKKRTVPLSFSSEEPVERWWGIEILDHSKKAVNLRRLKRGGALLIDHDMRNQVGVIEEVSIDEADRKGRASVRFGRSAKAEEIFQDVLDGIRSNVSVGYQIEEIILEKEVKDAASIYRVTEWEPYEISLVSVPADITVGVGRNEEPGAKEITIRMPAKPKTEIETEERVEFPHKEERKMSTKCEKCHGNLVDGKCPACETQREIEAKHGDPTKLLPAEYEKRRISAITKLAEMDKIDERTRDAWISQGYTVDQVADDIVAIRKERTKNTPVTDLGLPKRDVEQYSLIKAIRASYEQNWQNAPFELECTKTIAQKLGKVADPKRFYVPFDVLERPTLELGRGIPGRRDVSVGASGGAYLVATENIGFIELLRNRSVAFRMGATRLTGLVGNVTVPKQSAAATAYWLSSETATITESQQTFVQVALSPKNAGAYTEISRQLLLQSSPGVEAIVSNDLATVVALAVDVGVLRGSGGSGQPQGIVGTSGLGSVSGSSFAFGSIIEFQTDIAGSNVIPLRGGYVTPSAQAGTAMTKVKFASTASPIWEGNLWDGTVLGFPAMSSEQMASATMLFGDWSQVVVGEWGVLEVEVNPYASFAAGIIGIRAMYSMDVALRNAGAFSYASSISWA